MFKVQINTKYYKGLDMYNFLSNSENDTFLLGKMFGSKLNKGDIIILSGDLGSGKTKFTEGFLSYFNLEKEMSSPTFTIINEHYYNNVNIYHFDVYRLENIDEFYAIGGEEYLESGICIIEWGEKIETILPNNYIKILFQKDETNENIRKLTITVSDERLQNIVKEVLS